MNELRATVLVPISQLASAALNMKQILSALVATLPVLATATTKCQAPTAVLDSGPVVGVQTDVPGGIAPVNKYLGIPYAEPPERFELPQKPKKWRKPLKANEFGAACTQFVICGGAAPSCDIQNGLFNTDPPPESEDCLYMNAFAPATPGPKGGRPVVLVVHGGGFQLGHGRVDLSGFAATEDIVAFSFNYRTNIFGFPNSPDIEVEDRNLGFYDQQRAIEWVQSNAAAFGGDPTQVTLWGESAGAISVDAKLHQYAKADPPPFRGAIMQSGQMSYGLFATASDTKDQTSWDNAADFVGCGKKKTKDQLACMKKVPARRLIRALQTTISAFRPVVDNQTLPAKRAQAWRDGNVAQVPIIVSSIAEEGRGLVGQEMSQKDFDAAYLPDGLFTKKQRNKILKHYKSQPHLKTDFDINAAIYTDWVLQCPTKLIADTSASIENPVWRGYFNMSVTSMFPKELEFIGKFHGSDVMLLFSDPVYERIPGLSPIQTTFAYNYRSAIGRFVKNPTGGPGWPAVGSKAAPLDVVTMGDLGDVSTGGMTPVNETELDSICALYEDVYPILEQML